MNERLERRLSALEARAWNHRKHQILRSAFDANAEARHWGAERVASEVQAALDGWNRIEPALTAMVQRGASLEALVVHIAAETGLDVNALLGDAGRR